MPLLLLERRLRTIGLPSSLPPSHPTTVLQLFAAASIYDIAAGKAPL